MGLDLTYPIRACKAYALPRGKGARWALGAVLLLAAALRILFVQAPIRWDESANALYYTSHDLAHALFGSGGNPNHILHSLLSWFSVRILGWSLVSFRAPVLVAGMAAVWTVFMAAYWTLRRGGPAVLAAALAAVSPVWVTYSVNGRGYMYQAALLPLVYVLVVRGLRGDLGTRQARSCAVWAAALTALGALAVRSMLVFFIPLAVLAVGTWLLDRIRTGPRRRIGGFVLTWLGTLGGLTAMAFAPLAWIRGWDGVVGVASGYDARWARIVSETATSWLDLVQVELFRGHGPETLVVATLFVGLGLGHSLLKGPREPAAYALLLVPGSFLAAWWAHVWLMVRILAPGGFVLFLLWAQGAGWLVERGAGREGPRRAWALGVAGALALVPTLATLPGTPTRPDFVQMDHVHVQAAAHELFARVDLEGSALEVPDTWDGAPVAFYAMAAGLGIPNLVGLDRIAGERDPCDLESLVVVTEGDGHESPPASAVASRIVGEPLERFRLDGSGAWVTRWALAPCETGETVSPGR